MAFIAVSLRKLTKAAVADFENRQEKLAGFNVFGLSLTTKVIEKYVPCEYFQLHIMVFPYIVHLLYSPVTSTSLS